MVESLMVLLLSTGMKSPKSSAPSKLLAKAYTIYWYEIFIGRFLCRDFNCWCYGHAVTVCKALSNVLSKSVDVKSNRRLGLKALSKMW